MVAYGLTARICQRVIELAKQTGIKIGLIRPISLYPYPYETLAKLAEEVNGLFVVEMNAGQMVEDVRLGVEGKVPVDFIGRMGGMISSPKKFFISWNQSTNHIMQLKFRQKMKWTKDYI